MIVYTAPYSMDQESISNPSKVAKEALRDMFCFVRTRNDSLGSPALIVQEKSMNNPIALMIWLNVNGMYQSLRFSKTMMDAFFPRHQPAAEATPRAIAPVAGLGRGRCLGPADIRG